MSKTIVVSVNSSWNLLNFRWELLPTGTAWWR